MLLFIVFVFAVLNSGVSAAQEKRPMADGRAVTFVEYSETGTWRTWTDNRLSIRIPDGWIVSIDAKSNQKSDSDSFDSQDGTEMEWTYRVISSSGKRVKLNIDVVQGGPEFIDCFCAPKDVYEYSEKDGIKIWALSMPDLDTRLFKAASKTMRLDIHGELPDSNSDKMRYIIESARPVEPNLQKSR